MNCRFKPVMEFCSAEYILWKTKLFSECREKGRKNDEGKDKGARKKEISKSDGVLEAGVRWRGTLQTGDNQLSKQVIIKGIIGSFLGQRKT